MQRKKRKWYCYNERQRHSALLRCMQGEDEMRRKRQTYLVVTISELRRLVKDMEDTKDTARILLFKQEKDMGGDIALRADMNQGSCIA